VSYSQRVGGKQVANICVKFTAPTTWQLPKSDQRMSTAPSVRMRLYRSSCTRSRKFNVIYAGF